MPPINTVYIYLPSSWDSWYAGIAFQKHEKMGHDLCVLINMIWIKFWNDAYWDDPFYTQVMAESSNLDAEHILVGDVQLWLLSLEGLNQFTSNMAYPEVYIALILLWLA